MQLRGALGEALGVVERGVDVVDAAGADDHEQAVVIAVEDAGDRRAALEHGVLLLGGERQLLEDLRGRDQRHDLLDAAVANAVRVGCSSVRHLNRHPEAFFLLVRAGSCAEASGWCTPDSIRSRHKRRC